MKGINKVILVGNIGQDPETRFFPDGGAITNCSLATSERWKDKQTGQQQEKTEWHRLVFRDRGNYRLGQIAGEYIRKGSKIYVEGKLQTRKWQTNDGQDRYTTEIIVNELQLLDKPQQTQGHQTQGQPGYQTSEGAAYQQQPNPANQPAPNPSQPPPPPAGQPQGQHQHQPQGGGTFDNFDDDIPF